MARKVIIECDLCKARMHESDEMFSMHLEDREYEICGNCFSELKGRLASEITESKPIEDENDRLIMEKTSGESAPTSISPRIIKGTIEDIPIKTKGGDSFLGEETRDYSGGAVNVDGCSHLNKTRPKYGRVKIDGEVKEQMYRTCKDCGVPMVVRTMAERKLDLKTSDDVTLRDHSAESRKGR